MHFFRAWDDDLLHDVIACLSEDFVADNDKSADNYKLSVATAFFFKFYNQVRTDLVYQTNVYYSLLCRLKRRHIGITFVSGGSVGGGVGGVGGGVRISLSGA